MDIHFYTSQFMKDSDKLKELKLRLVNQKVNVIVDRIYSHTSPFFQYLERILLSSRHKPKMNITIQSYSYTNFRSQERETINSFKFCIKPETKLEQLEQNKQIGWLKFEYTDQNNHTDDKQYLNDFFQSSLAL